MRYFFVELKPPQIDAQCLVQDGKAHFRWCWSPGQGLSLTYLNRSKFGWIISGNCKHQNTVVVSSYITSYTVHIYMYWDDHDLYYLAS